MSLGLLDRLGGFCAALREADVPVSVAEHLDAVRCFAAVDPTDRGQVRAGLAAALVKRPGHRATFDVLFDLWFPAALGDPADAPAADRRTPGGGEPRESGPDSLRELLRQALLDALIRGDDAALRRLARQVVAGFGAVDEPNGERTWLSYRAQRAVDAQTLMAQLLEALLAGPRQDDFAERVARATANERLDAFRRYVDEETRRRAAERRGPRRIAAHSVPRLAEQVEFLRASREEMAALRRVVYPLARRLATRLAARRAHGRSGRLDVRRTMRSSLATGGVPVVTHHRPRRPHRPELVVLCDVSGSAAGFAHFTLLLTAALREQFTRVRAFAFVDTTDEISHLLGHGIDLPDAVSRLSREADLVWFDGHSDYGHAFEVFAERWPDAIGPNTSLLVLGDARTNYRSPGLPTLRRLVRAARHAYWLNPEPARYWGGGDSVAPAYGEVLPMVECRTAEQLTAFVADLLPR